MTYKQDDSGRDYDLAFPPLNLFNGPHPIPATAPDKHVKPQLRSRISGGYTIFGLFVISRRRSTWMLIVDVGAVGTGIL